MTGQKVRVNVSALSGETPVSKFLVCIDEGAFVQDLAAKVRKNLARQGVQWQLTRLDNAQHAHIPEEEPVGDVLRDGEDVIAVLQKPEERLLAEKKVEAIQAGDLKTMLTVHAADGGEEEEEEPYEPVPGPATAFEGDDGDGDDDDSASSAGAPAADWAPGAARPGQPSLQFPKKGPGDWEVSELTPKLREFVATRFKEVHGIVAEPGNTFITVRMTPRHPEAALPVHYSIARIDVIEFERLCGKKVQELRTRADFFARCQQSLQSLLESGAMLDDYAPNMLPYRYRSDGEFDDLLREADGPCFGQVEGNRPIVVLDTSGAAGEALPVLKAALKRMLYSFLVTKSKFNFLKFSAQGHPLAFDAEMAPPAAQRLREAEEWLDTLRPVRSAGPAGGGPDLAEALRLAVSSPQVDVVYLLSSGLSKRQDAARFLADVRARNLRNVPIHVIGLDCDMKAELDFRRLAEESQGTFRHKRFDGPPAFPGAPAEPRRLPAIPAAGDAAAGGGGDARLSVRGQLDILDIMLQEDEGQTQEWLQEQRCANQLLLATATQQAVPDPRQARLHAMRQAEALAQRPRLQDMIEAGGSAPGPPPAAAATAAAAALAGYGPGAAVAAAAAAARRRPATPTRRGGGQPAQHGRAASQPRMGTRTSEIRRPSVANPWDKPYMNSLTGVVRVSQLKQAADAATARGQTGPCPTGHAGVAAGGAAAAAPRPCSARRRRPLSAGRRR